MKWFMLFNFLLINYGVFCAEIGNDVVHTSNDLKKVKTPIDKVKLSVSKTDKEFQQKLNDLQKTQLQKTTNFIPGFKIALQSFFAYDWQEALKNQNQKKIQDEVLKWTKRLQDDYAQLVVQDLIDSLTQLGSYFSIQTIDSENKKELTIFIQDVKNAQNDIYESVTKYSEQAKNILAPLLAFVDLSPSPYQVWYKIHQSVVDQNIVLEKFVAVVQPLIEENNTTNLENHITKAMQTFGFLQTQWKSYAQKVNMFLGNLLTNVQQEQELKTLLNRIFIAKVKIEQSLSKFIGDFGSVSCYASFIPSVNFVDQWLKLIVDTQKMTDQWGKTSKEWHNKFSKLVERHQSVYEYLTKKKIMSDIKKSFSLEDGLLKKNNELIMQAQKNLTQQKARLQAKHK